MGWRGSRLVGGFYGPGLVGWLAGGSIGPLLLHTQDTYPRNHSPDPATAPGSIGLNSLQRRFGVFTLTQRVKVEVFESNAGLALTSAVRVVCCFFLSFPFLGVGVGRGVSVVRFGPPL